MTQPKCVRIPIGGAWVGIMEMPEGWSATAPHDWQNLETLGRPTGDTLAQNSFERFRHFAPKDTCALWDTFSCTWRSDRPLGHLGVTPTLAQPERFGAHPGKMCAYTNRWDMGWDRGDARGRVGDSSPRLAKFGNPLAPPWRKILLRQFDILL